MITSRPFCWLATLTWAALIALLMLTPGEDSIAQDVSGFFGGTEFGDWLGHIVLFAVFTLLLWWLVRAYRPSRALLLSAAIAISVGTLTELAQHWVPYRGVTLYDLLGNAFGVVLMYSHLRRINPIADR